MATTKLSICNSALDLLGIRPILNFSSVNKRVSTCSRHYDRARQEILKLGHWNFAQKRAELTALSDAPVFEHATYYELPNDYLDVVEFDATDHETYEFSWNIESFEGQTVLATEAESGVVIRYTYDCQDASKFSPLFTSLLELLLASRMAVPLRASPELSQKYYSLYSKRLEEFKGQNESEGDPTHALIDDQDEGIFELKAARWL